MPPELHAGRSKPLWRRMRVARGAERKLWLGPALSAAGLSRQRFARPIAYFLSRSLLVLVEGLPVGGFTWPLLPTNIIAPVILLDAGLQRRGSAEVARILLHEAAHHCGVVWPEWRNWANSFARYVLFFIRWHDRRYPVFAYARIYGLAVNSADRVAHAIITDAQARGWQP